MSQAANDSTVRYSHPGCGARSFLALLLLAGISACDGRDDPDPYPTHGSAGAEFEAQVDVSVREYLDRGQEDEARAYLREGIAEYEDRAGHSRGAARRLEQLHGKLRWLEAEIVRRRDPHYLSSWEIDRPVRTAAEEIAAILVQGDAQGARSRLESTLEEWEERATLSESYRKVHDEMTRSLRGFVVQFTIARLRTELRAVVRQGDTAGACERLDALRDRWRGPALDPELSSKLLSDLELHDVEYDLRAEEVWFLLASGRIDDARRLARQLAEQWGGRDQTQQARALPELLEDRIRRQSR